MGTTRPSARAEESIDSATGATVAYSVLKTSIQGEVETTAEMSWHPKESIPESSSMVDDGPLRRAIGGAWSVHRAKHRGVDAADNRRCLLDVICRRDGKRASAMPKNSRSSAFAYLERLPDDEC
jgi:hypothetical protein